MDGLDGQDEAVEDDVDVAERLGLDGADREVFHQRVALGGDRSAW
jgi:hypothetical protein